MTVNSILLYSFSASLFILFCCEAGRMSAHVEKSLNNGHDMCTDVVLLHTQSVSSHPQEAMSSHK